MPSGREPRTRADLIAVLRGAHRMLGDEGLGITAERLAESKWKEALLEAHGLDGAAKKVIPPWGWEMLRNAVAAQCYLKEVNGDDV